MSALHHGGPAFPAELREQPNGPQGPTLVTTFSGMTLRDWFAGQALAVISGQFDIRNMSKRDLELIAATSYELADAMLAARAKAGAA